MSKLRPSGFWDRLIEVSRERGMECTPAAIAREADVWPSAVTKWVQGTGLPTSKHIIALATARGVNTEWLLTGQGEKYAKLADPVTREMFDTWARLTDEPRKRLLAAARYELSIQVADIGPVVAEVVSKLSA